MNLSLGGGSFPDATSEDGYETREAGKGGPDLGDSEQEISVGHSSPGVICRRPTDTAFSCVAAECGPAEAPSFNARHYHGSLGLSGATPAARPCYAAASIQVAALGPRRISAELEQPLVVRDVRQALLTPRCLKELRPLAQPAADLATAPDAFGLAEAPGLALAEARRRLGTRMSELKVKTPGSKSSSPFESGTTHD